MTPEERAAKLAREICVCSCYAPKAAPADNRGPLKDGSHYANCAAENKEWAAADIAAAIREAVKAERHANIMAAENLREGNPRSNRARGYNDACDDIAADIRKRPL